MRIFAWALMLTTFGMGGAVLAQDDSTTTSYPPSYLLTGITHIYQDWNNCGPATLTMGLSYFGYPVTDQHVAANWLKPNYEDKNVSPWQMAEYVNTQLDGSIRAIVRQGGTLDQLKTLISNDFPVLTEEGYDPPGRGLGWMGHYLLMVGYDDARQVFRQLAQRAPFLALWMRRIHRHQPRWRRSILGGVGCRRLRDFPAGKRQLGSQGRIERLG